MSEDVAARRAAALESAATPEDDPAERETADRIRALLAHPAMWATAPDMALPRAELVTEAGAPAVDDVPVVDLGRRRRVRRTVSWAATVAAVAAAAVLAVSLLLVPSSGTTGPAPESFQLALAGTGQVSEASASVTATKLTAGWEFTLDVVGLPGAPQGTYYQGWVLRGDTVVPLGTFHLRQPGVVRLWAGVAVDEFTRVEITRQQVGASGGRGEVMMTGSIPH